MCHSHSLLSSAMCSQFRKSPFALGFVVMMVSPVVLHLVVVVSKVSVGRSAFRLLTIAFLLVDRTPDCGLGFLIQAVMRSFGGCTSGDRVIFPR